MKHYTEKQRQVIADTLKEFSGDIGRTAKYIGVSEGVVAWVDTIHNRKFGAAVPGKGRPELTPYIVGIRPRDRGIWDNENPKIAKARELYDKGLVEVATAVDGDNLILYAIPRHKKDNNRKIYFANMEEEND